VKTSDLTSLKPYTETVIDASKEDAVEVNADDTRSMFLSRHQNAGQHDKDSKSDLLKLDL
jgi:hypothetical protein